MEHWELGLLNIASILFMAIMAYFIKRVISQIDKRLEDGDARFKELSKAMSEFKEKRGFDREYFAKEYVAKDDFIRDIRALDYKVDLVIGDIKKLLVLTGGRGGQDAGI